MASIICAKCGGTTNTALCNWFSPLREDGKANECYARWNKEKGNWEKGCSKEDDRYTNKMLSNLMNKEVE